MEGIALLAAKEIWAEALSAVSFLSWPVIGPILSWAFFYAVSWLIKVSERFERFLVLGWKVDAETKKYSGAKDKLKEALATGDPYAIKQASDEYDQALGELAQNDISDDSN